MEEEAKQEKGRRRRRMKGVGGGKKRLHSEIPARDVRRSSGSRKNDRLPANNKPQLSRTVRNYSCRWSFIFWADA